MNDLPFSLGFKLSLGWREQQMRGQLPPAKGEVYDLLRRRGFDYFEFGVGACKEQDEVLLIHREAAACAECGLGIALHPYLAGPDNPAVFGETAESAGALESVLAAASTAGSISGGPVALVLHPAEWRYEPDTEDLAAARRRLLTRSQDFFAALAECAVALHPQAQPVVEHQVPPAPGERVLRIGDTYAELLEVVAGTDLGICWDTGHYLLSVERHGQAERPPVEFLRRVEVVHLHDVVAGRDHSLISLQSDRLRDYVQMLLGSGFRGNVTLEYSGEAIRSGGSFERVIAESVEVLKAWTS